jgi:outer membrane autotransporter protein
MVFMSTKKKIISFLAIIIMTILSSNVSAGHLFTQAGSNTPINLTAGNGLNITQLTYEGSSNSGSVLIYLDQTNSGDANLEWSAGDAMKVIIGSWTQNFVYDTLTTDFAGANQSTSSISLTDPTLAAANITPGGAQSTFTVIATAGAFRFEGYRIEVVGDKYNGTGADTINQSQVVNAGSLGVGGFESAAETNQTALGGHLDQIDGGSISTDLQTVITVISAMTDESKALAMKLISPEQSQVLGQSATNTVSSSFDTVQVRLDALRSGNTAAPLHQSGVNETGLSSGDQTSSIIERHAWLKALGGKADQDSEGGFAGSDSDYHGVMGGIDFTTDTNLTAGLAFAYAKTNVNMNDYRSGDGADIDTYQLTGYFSRSLENFYLEGMLTYAYHNYETIRNTHLTGIAQGDFNGDMVAARLISGLPITLSNNVILTPYLGMEAFHARQRGYTESGAGALSLNVASNSANRVRSLAGIKVSTHKQLTDGSILIPMLQANWRHEFKDDGVSTTSSFLGGGGQFQSVGQNVDRNVYGLTGRLNWQKTDRLSLGIEIGAEAATGYRSYNGQLYGNWLF